MTLKRKILLIVPVSTLLGIALVLWVGTAEIRALRTPHFEVGTHAGAEVCGQCHQEIFEQWSTRSRHAQATSGIHFLEFRDKAKENFLINAMIGEEACYACHGSQEANQGVTCETCHGLLDNETPVMEVHAAKFSPRMATLRSDNFCAPCHTLGEVMTPYSDWQESDAARRGISCQGCHMSRSDDGVPYHGFDSIVLDGTAYRGDLTIQDIFLDYPRLEVTVENHIIGHGVPTGQPMRVLALEISLMDVDGRALYETKSLFRRIFDLMPVAGLMPLTLIEDTHLGSGEARRLTFDLPAELEDRIVKAQLLLRFYEVFDEYQGDISRAHWIGDPIAVEEIVIIAPAGG